MSDAATLSSAQKVGTSAQNLGIPPSKMGRPVGAKDRATTMHRASISELARKYTNIAIKALADICENGESESARVSAAEAILNRGYGKPAQEITGTIDLGDRSQRLTQVLILTGASAEDTRKALEGAVSGLISGE